MIGLKHIRNFLLVAGLFFMACEGGEDLKQQDTWLEPAIGVYQGIIPCADCEGVRYNLELKQDFRYESTLVYMGKSEDPETESGEFGFVNDSTIVLKKEDAGFEYFRVGEEGLMLLDTDGQHITGPLAAEYHLKRMSDRDGNISGDGESFSDALDTTILNRKWKKGIDFYASGKDTSWTLDLDFHDAIVFRAENGTELIALAEMREFSGEGDQYTYTVGNNARGEIQIVIYPGQCGKALNNTRTMFGVNVKIKAASDSTFSEYYGCGRYIPNPMLKNIWVLDRIDNQPVEKKNFKKGLPMIEFFLAESTINGHDGCNNFIGSFYSYSNVISLGPIVSTKMACENMEQSNKFLKFLVGQPLVYGIEDNKLVVTNEERNRLVFRRAR